MVNWLSPFVAWVSVWDHSGRIFLLTSVTYTGLCSCHATTVLCRATSGYRTVPLRCSGSVLSFMKFRVVTRKIRTFNPLRIASVFLFKQTLNMETVRFIFTSDKHLMSYGRDEQKLHVDLREKSKNLKIKIYRTVIKQWLGNSRKHNWLFIIASDGG